MTVKNCLWVAAGNVRPSNGYGARVGDTLRASAGIPALTHHALVFLKPTMYLGARELRSWLLKYAKRVVVLPSVPARSLRLDILGQAWMAEMISRQTKMLAVSHIYAHGLRACHGAVSAKLPRASRVICDPHGVAVEEMVLCGRLKPGSRRYEYLSDLERAVAQNASVTVAVSDVMGEYLRSVRGRSGEIVKVPCAVDTDLFCYSDFDRNRVRKNLGIGKETLFVYSGSFSGWQNIPGMLDVFKRALAVLGDCRLLLLSPDSIDKVNSYIDNAELPSGQILVRSAERSEVASYLSASDIGLLIREQNIVNRVASPTKLGEYLSCGLPVLISPEVGDFSKEVEKGRLGIVVDSNAAAPARSHLKALTTSETRNRCIEYAREHLSWSVHERRITDLLLQRGAS